MVSRVFPGDSGLFNSGAINHLEGATTWGVILQTSYCVYVPHTRHGNRGKMTGGDGMHAMSKACGSALFLIITLQVHEVLLYCVLASNTHDTGFPIIVLDAIPR